MSHIRRNRWKSLLVLVATLLFCAALGIMYPKVMYYRQPFNGELWRTTSSRDDSHPPRQRMVDNLIGRRLLMGLSHAEIETLLGPAPNTGYFSEYDLVYRLGYERGFISIDSEWLVVKLGADGRAVDAKLVTD